MDVDLSQEARDLIRGVASDALSSMSLEEAQAFSLDDLAGAAVDLAIMSPVFPGSQEVSGAVATHGFQAVMRVAAGLVNLRQA